MFPEKQNQLFSCLNQLFFEWLPVIWIKQNKIDGGYVKLYLFGIEIEIENKKKQDCELENVLKESYIWHEKAIIDDVWSNRALKLSISKCQYCQSTADVTSSPMYWKN